MRFKVALQSVLIAGCAGLGGAALSLRSTVRGVTPLPMDEAYALRDASALTHIGTHDHPAHRRIYAYRLEALMPSRFATEQVHSKHVLHTRGGDEKADEAKDDTPRLPHPSLSPSLGSLYALHALESTRPFRWAWMWRTFADTYRVSDTFNVWCRTRPSWMAATCATIAAAPRVDERERIIHDAAAEVETLSGGRYEAQLESGDVHGAVVRGGPRGTPVAAPLYAVRFDLPEVPDREAQLHPRPRSAPLYVLYVSEPYSSDSPTERQERLQIWVEEWYSRWLAAHVVKALAAM